MLRTDYFSKNDSEHIVVTDVDIAHNGVLHRFKNGAGEPYSAIYVGDIEYFSCPRDDEARMIQYWNEMED